MSIVVLAVMVLVPLAVLLAAATVLIAVLAGRRPQPAPSQAAATARQHGLMVAGLAWIAAGGAALAVGPLAPTLARLTDAGSLGTGVVLALGPTLVALVYLGVHAVGERTWPRPAGPIRRASLAPRGRVAPRALTALTVGLAAALVLTLGGTGLTADGGRALTVVRPSATMSAGPYPGWFYGAPILLGAGLAALACLLTLRLVARRPAVVDAEPDYDDASRQLSAHRILRGVQAMLAATEAGVLLTAATACHNVGLTGWATALNVGALLAVVAGLVGTVLPGPRLPGGAPAAPWATPADDLGAHTPATR